MPLPDSNKALFKPLTGPRYRPYPQYYMDIPPVKPNPFVGINGEDPYVTQPNRPNPFVGIDGQDPYVGGGQPRQPVAQPTTTQNTQARAPVTQPSPYTGKQLPPEGLILTEGTVQDFYGRRDQLPAPQRETSFRQPAIDENNMFQDAGNAISGAISGGTEEGGYNFAEILGRIAQGVGQPYDAGAQLGKQIADYNVQRRTEARQDRQLDMAERKIEAGITATEAGTEVAKAGIEQADRRLDLMGEELGLKREQFFDSQEQFDEIQALRQQSQDFEEIYKDQVVQLQKREISVAEFRANLSEQAQALDEMKFFESTEQFDEVQKLREDSAEFDKWFKAKQLKLEEKKIDAIKFKAELENKLKASKVEVGKRNTFYKQFYTQIRPMYQNILPEGTDLNTFLGQLASADSPAETAYSIVADQVPAITRYRIREASELAEGILADETVSGAINKVMPLMNLTDKEYVKAFLEEHKLVDEKGNVKVTAPQEIKDWVIEEKANK